MQINVSEVYNSNLNQHPTISHLSLSVLSLTVIINPVLLESWYHSRFQFSHSYS